MHIYEFMSFAENYSKSHYKLLNDTSICKENRELYTNFFQRKETKLKRTNGFSKLDESCFKTLYKYIQMVRNVNSWFRNKPLIKLTKEDIEKVYNDLEDGIIKNKKAQGSCFNCRRA